MGGAAFSKRYVARQDMVEIRNVKHFLMKVLQQGILRYAGSFRGQTAQDFVTDGGTGIFKHKEKRSMHAAGTPQKLFESFPTDIKAGMAGHIQQKSLGMLAVKMPDHGYKLAHHLVIGRFEQLA